MSTYPVASTTCARCGVYGEDIWKKGWASTELAGIICRDCYKSLIKWREPMFARHAKEYQQVLKRWLADKEVEP